jgi:hypothetical protein
LQSIGKTLLCGVLLLALASGVASAHAGKYRMVRVPCCWTPPGNPPPPEPPGSPEMSKSEPTCSPEDGWWSLVKEVTRGPNLAVTARDLEPAFVRDRAARTRAIGALLGFARSNAGVDVRAAALLAVGSVAASGDEERPWVLAHMRATLADPQAHRSMRFACALGLGLMRDRSYRGIALRVEILGQRDLPPALRTGAAFGLAMLRLRPGDPGHAMVARSLDRAAREESETGVDVASCALLASGISRDPCALEVLLDRIAAGGRGTARACSAAAVALICEARPDLATDEVIGLLLTASRSGDAVARRGMIVALGRIGRIENLSHEYRAMIVRVLLDRTFSEDESTATAALVGLGRTGTVLVDANVRSGLTARLVTVLRRGQEMRRPYAALALGILSRDRGLTPWERGSIRTDLRAAMRDWGGRSRDLGACAVALGLVGGPEAVSDLITTLNRKDAPGPLRVSCVTGLGLAGDPTATEVLRNLVRGDNCCDLRTAASRASWLLGDPIPTSLILAAHRQPSSSHHNLCSKRIRVMGKAGDEGALRHLLAMLANGKLSDSTRSKAASSVAELLERRGRPHLAEFAADIDHHLRSIVFSWLPTAP